MPDIDRNALNRELLHRLSLHPKITIAQVDVLRLDYCTNLNAIVDALNALGLSWGVATGPNPISCAFVTDGVKSCEVPSTDDSSAALATALVQAALALLEREEENDETC